MARLVLQVQLLWWQVRLHLLARCHAERWLHHMHPAAAAQFFLVGQLVVAHEVTLIEFRAGHHSARVHLLVGRCHDILLVGDELALEFLDLLLDLLALSVELVVVFRVALLLLRHHLGLFDGWHGHLAVVVRRRNRWHDGNLAVVLGELFFLVEHGGGIDCLLLILLISLSLSNLIHYLIYARVRTITHNVLLLLFC